MFICFRKRLKNSKSEAVCSREEKKGAKSKRKVHSYFDVQKTWSVRLREKGNARIYSLTFKSSVKAI